MRAGYSMGDKIKSQASPGTFLGRLARNVRGNTLALMAAALVPLTAMIGSGVDMTRAYMAQNRLRQACDAGSLAGRRLLAGTTITQPIRDETTKYFQFNFPQGQFQTANYTLAITAPTSGTLQVVTETTIPTTIMKMFGFASIPLSASCSATQDFVNTDIMMVFDLSGSMNCAPGVGGACDEVEQTGSKIAALRTAAKSFYDTLEPAQNQLHANNLRLRYGFVNYNSTVNVGRILYAKNPDWLVQNWQYSSRTPDFYDDTVYLRNKTDCNNAWTRDAEAQYVNSSWRGIMGGWWMNGNTCRIIYQSTGNEDGYTYNTRTFDVRPYMTSTSAASVWLGPVTGTHAPPNDRADDFNSVWNGCIEERQTNSSAIDGGTSTTAPSDAYDLDIDLIPNSDVPNSNVTRWRPMWADAYWYPEWLWPIVGSQPGNYCPTQAVRLQEYYNNESAFTTYVDGLRARGGTYHDLGMIWGARFISPTGLFKSATPETNNQNDPDNPTKIRGFNVKKYMIFMTDGDMAPTWNAYSAYGVEGINGRVMGSPSYDNDALTRRHLQRFRMACNAAKSKGIDVWVVAFATTLTADMQNCASKPEQASGLSTNAALIAKFQEIGSKIGSLRLSR